MFQTRSPWPVRAIVAVGIVRATGGLWLGFHPFDDTFITFRYARNLASGLGFVYNAGDHVLGTTTPLWTVVLAVLEKAGLSPETTALYVPLLADIGTALLIFGLLLQLRYDTHTALSAALLFLALFDSLSLSRSGMETSVFSFLTIATIAAVASAQFPVAGGLASLATLTRPEGLVLLVVLAIAMLVQWRHSETRALLATVVVVTTILGAWAVYATTTFGSVVPQSLVAKSAADQPALARFSSANVALFLLRGQYGGQIYSRTYLQLMPALSALSGFAAVRLLIDVGTMDRKAFLKPVLLLTFPICVGAALAFGHAFTFFPWYYGPFYPFLAMLAIIGAARLSSHIGLRIVWPTAILIAAQLLAGAYVKLPRSHPFGIEGYRQVAAVIPNNVDVSVAAFEIGTVGWTAWRVRVLDLAGLVTPDAVAVPPERFLQNSRPDFLVLRTDNAADFLRRTEETGWLAANYDVVASVGDPYTTREFRTYARKLSSR